VVDCVVEPEVPVTVIVYVPAGVPLGFTVVPPPLPLEPHPATRKTKKTANVPSGAMVMIRGLRSAQRVKNEIPRTISVPVPGSMWRRLLVIEDGSTAVRDIVVMTNGAVEFAGTVTAGHAAPVCNPEHVRAYETVPKSVIVKFADEPADTVCEGGEALNWDRLPYATFRTVLPPSRSEPVSGGPNGATIM
jgi:hypothetical protein